MRYFANYEADAVIREDDNGERYKKTIENLSEGSPVSKDDKEAWGIPSFGYYNFRKSTQIYNTITYSKTKSNRHIDEIRRK